MKEPIKVVILPTEDKTNLFLDENNDSHFFTDLTSTRELATLKGQYVYITVSPEVEPIKEGNWVYNQKSKEIYQITIVEEVVSYESKIIATTDPRLVLERIEHLGNSETKFKTPIPQLQQSFLKEFVANPDGEYLVEYKTYYSKLKPNGLGGWVHNQWVKKAETPNQVYNFDNTKEVLKVNKDNTVNITSVEEKMYSEKELIKKVVEGMRAMNKYIIDTTTMRGQDAKMWSINWIKENLK